MSRRFTVLMILILLLVGLNGAILADETIGDKIAGAWLGNGQFALDLDCNGEPDYLEPGGGPPPTDFDYDSQSFAASGLYIATNPANPNLGHGTWKQTGAYEIKTNNITYLNVPWPVTVTVPLKDSEGFRIPLGLQDALTGTGTAGPPATLNFIARIPGTFTFEADFKTATSTFGAIAYLPGTDPLDPNNTPLFCTVGQHELLQKVTVNPADFE